MFIITPSFIIIRNKVPLLCELFDLDYWANKLAFDRIKYKLTAKLEIENTIKPKPLFMKKKYGGLWKIFVKPPYISSF